MINDIDGYRRRIESNGWKIIMPTDVCPSMALYILGGISEFTRVSISEGTTGDGKCAGKLGGEFGCNSKYRYVFSPANMTVTVTADQCKG